jgi:hypothetical protein
MGDRLYDGSDFVEKWVLAFCRAMGLGDKWTSRLGKEAAACILLRTKDTPLNEWQSLPAVMRAGLADLARN